MDKNEQQPAEDVRREEGQMDVIYGAYPPNIELLLEHFPNAAAPGVVFAYGDEIYVPSGKELTQELKVHEAVHGIRQKELGLDLWWQKYIEDEDFRYHEELIAHFAEFRALIAKNESRPYRRRAIKHIARKLAHPIYKFKGGIDKATRDLKKMEREYLEGKKS